MKNESFREIGYWGSIVSVVFCLVNIIICFVKGVKLFDTTLQRDSMRLIIYPCEICFSTILYKVSVIILFLSLLMMFISYIINTDSVKKILMIICKVIQLLCVCCGLIGYFKFCSSSFIKKLLMCFAVVELIVLILYLIDRGHRKTIIRVAILTIITVGSGVVYLLFAIVLFLWIMGLFVSLLSVIFGKHEPKNVVYDTTGKIIGYWKRE